MNPEAVFQRNAMRGRDANDKCGWEFCVETSEEQKHCHEAAKVREKNMKTDTRQ